MDDAGFVCIRRIAVEARDTGIGEHGRQLFFDSLCPRPELLERAAAVGADARIRRRIAAMMADHPSVQVIAQRDVAVGTLDNRPAFFTLEGRRIGTAGAEDDRLPALFEDAVDLEEQLAGKMADHPALFPLGHRVDHAHFRLFPMIEAFLQDNMRKAPVFSIIQRLQGWSCAAQDDLGAMDPGEHNGRVAAVVPGRRRILFIRGVVLFIDNDEAEVVMGQEQGGTRSQDDGGAAFPEDGGDLPLPDR